MKAYVDKIRISPTKLRLVVNAVRLSKSLEHAFMLLRGIHKKGSSIVYDAIHSAIANAEHNHSMNKSNIELDQIFVGESSIRRKLEIKGRGKTGRIANRYSNLTVILRSKEEKNGTEN